MNTDREGALNKQDAQVLLAALSCLSAESIDMELVDLCARAIHGGVVRPDPVRRERLAARLSARCASGHRRLRRHTLVALIVLLILAVTAICAVAGWPSEQEREAEAMWNDSFYHFSLYNDPHRMRDSLSTDIRPTGINETLDRLLVKNDLRLPLPTWLPGEYCATSISLCLSEGMEADLSAVFYPRSADHEFSICLQRQPLGDEVSSYASDAYFRKDDGYYEEYLRDGNRFILFSNGSGCIRAIWICLPYMLDMSGYVSAAQMRQVVDSIFERRAGTPVPGKTTVKYVDNFLDVREPEVGMPSARDLLGFRDDESIWRNWPPRRDQPDGSHSWAASSYTGIVSSQ